MASKDIVFWLTILLSIFAVLLTLIVIFVAIYFQNLRKTIEGEINSSQRVAKMTARTGKKQNKYSKSKKRQDEEKLEFYDAPPMTDVHRDALQTNAAEKRENNDGHVKRRSKPERTTEIEDLYIHCIADDEEPLQKMTTFQSAQVSSKGGRAEKVPQKFPSQTLPPMTCTEDKGSYVEFIASTPREATLPAHGFKGSSYVNVTQQKTSRNTTRRAKSNDTKLNGEEMYEIMSRQGKIYENSGYTNESNEDLYGNQEIIEQDNKRVSQGNMSHLTQELTSTWRRDSHSRTANENQDRYEEELYENQEVVNRERNNSAKYVNDTYLKGGHLNKGGMTTRQTNSNTPAMGAESIELYENYIHEEMYENC